MLPTFLLSCLLLGLHPRDGMAQVVSQDPNTRKGDPISLKHLLHVGDLVVAKWPAYRGNDDHTHESLVAGKDNPWFAGNVTAIDRKRMRCTIHYVKEFCRGEGGKTCTNSHGDVQEREVLYAPSRDDDWGKGHLRGNFIAPDGAKRVIFKIQATKFTLVKKDSRCNAPGIEWTKKHLLQDCADAAKDVGANYFIYGRAHHKDKCGIAPRGKSEACPEGWVPDEFDTYVLEGMATCAYDEKTCRHKAAEKGLVRGGSGYMFAGNYESTGCFAMNAGKYAGMAFYGYVNPHDRGFTDGSSGHLEVETESELSPIESPSYRVPGTFDCKAMLFGHGNGCVPEAVWREQRWTNFYGAFERCGTGLVCVAGHPTCKEYCKRDSECENYPLRVCRDQKCIHKDLFEGNSAPDVGTALLFFFVSGLALSAGIGGGGLYVPLLMVLLGFTVKEATALSQACLSGGASTALVYNLRQRHPSGNKPMIDYALLLVMGPNLLIGALIGATLNTAAPSWLILTVLMVVLCQSVVKTCKKATQTYRDENAGDVQGVPESGDVRLSKNPIDRCIRFLTGASFDQFTDEETPGQSSTIGRSGGKLDTITEDKSASMAAAPPQDLPEGENPFSKAANPDSSKPSDVCVDLDLAASPKGGDFGPAASLQSADGHMAAARTEGGPVQRQYPSGKLAAFFVMWIIVVLSIFLRGGKHFHGVVTYCSFAYWLFAPITMVALSCISLHASKRAVDMAPRTNDGEFSWTVRSAAKVSIWCLMGGTLAALCGIGGGMIIAPMLLDLGFLPQVQSATTATTLFVMSTSTCLAFLVAGTAPVDYAFWLAVATGLGAILGKAFIGYFVKKFRRPSMIIFLLGGIIAVSAIVMAVTGSIDVVNDIQHGKDLMFKSLSADCPVEEL